MNASDKLVAGVTFDVAGMGHRDPESRLIDGFEVDLVRQLAELLLNKPENVEFVEVRDDQRIEALQQGIVDLVASQLTITEDRAELVDFSIPYFTAKEALLVPCGSPIRTLADLEGKRVAATAGSLSLRRMRTTLAEECLVIKPLTANGLEAVETGEADAASNDNINLMLMRNRSAHPERFELLDIGDCFDEKNFAIAVKKGNTALLSRINNALTLLKEDGVIESILRKYL